MGKQYDKVIKRRRRLAYLERRKEKAEITAPAPALVASHLEETATAPAE